MLGINHVTSATAATLGLSLAFEQPFFLPLIAFVAFGALFPDVDHVDSQVSKSIPGLSNFLKHRGPTHSFLGILVFSLICYLLLGIHPALSYILIFFGFIGLGFLRQILEKQVKRAQSFTKNFFSHKQFILMISLVRFVVVVFLIMLMFFVWNQKLSLEILALLTIGYVVHLIGDFLTKDGVPWLWPYDKKFALRLFKTGGIFENVLGLFLILLNGYLLFLFSERFSLSSLDYWQNYLYFLTDFDWQQVSLI